MMHFFHADHHPIPLPEGHRFPGGKYAMLRQRLLAAHILCDDQILPAPRAMDDEILRAHDPDYVTGFETGQLDEKAIRRIGFPWSPALVERVRATMGGAVAAAGAALETGLSGLLAGGTHHAHRDIGSGFCIYNDQAVAGLWALAQPGVNRIAIVDLDVHQGDGTAAILADRPDAFVFSMHGDRNFPFRKQRSDLDVALKDGLEDEEYLEALEQHLPAVMDFEPDLILYQAGVDGLAEDRLGRLSLSLAGLVARDQMVFMAACKAGIPVSMAIGGGYADPIDLTVEANVNTYRVAKSIYGF